MHAMQRFEISHRFECTPTQYLEVIDSAEFHERLKGLLSLRERTLLERREDGEHVHVRWHVVPERDLPAPVKAFLGGKGMAYVEEERRNKSDSHREWRIHLDALDAKRFRCHGTFDLTELGGGEIRRDVRGEIEVKAFGVGGVVERMIVKGTQDSYEKTTALVKELLAERRR
jgi:hypothetical protein